MITNKAWHFLAGLVLVGGIAISVYASLEVRGGVDEKARERFAFTSDQIALKIRERLTTYALILRGGAGLFAGAETVSRDEWRVFVDTLRASDNVPGIQGIGFSQQLRPEQLAQHIAKVRAEGFPSYTVRPPGKRELYSSIVFLEPFRDRNLRAFGFDMYSEPVRRDAMERARDTGNAALSGKVELVQEDGNDVQAGCLMYFPVYRKGAPLATVEQRRAALLGWTYSPYRMKDLIGGMLADWMALEEALIDLHIYDGQEAVAGRLLYDNHPNTPQDRKSPYFQQRLIEFGGHRWLLVFDALPGSLILHYGNAWAVLFGGVALSALLGSLIIALARTRRRAEEIAGTLTAELRGRESALRASDAFKDAILDAIPSHIAVIDADGCIVAVNTAWRRFAVDNDGEADEATHNTGIGVNYLDVCLRSQGASCDDAQIVHDGIVAVLEGRSASFVHEYPCPSPQQARWFLMSVTPLPGPRLSAVIAHLDITRRMMAEDELRRHRDDLETIVAERTEELRQHRDRLEMTVAERTAAYLEAKEAAEQASRSKSQFLANMSHELRTPMNAIMGMTEIVRRQLHDPEQAKRLAKVKQASIHLLNVINDILDLSKIEAGRLTLEHVDFDLSEVFDNLVTIAGQKAQEKGLELRIDVAPELKGISVCGDSLRLGQVLLNLVGNSVKFTDTGHVTVRATRVECDGPDIGLHIEVQDTGIGIPDEYRARIFSAFEQANGSMARRYGGTGLGLAISKHLVELMRGTIGVTSVPGAGSTFWFDICLATGCDACAMPGQQAPHTAEGLIRGKHGGRRVLLVEDEPTNQEVARMLLAETGLLVDLAGDGAQAVDMARATPYALILMDMQMPVMSGLDATRAIRSESANEDTPIVAMTANAFEEDRNACIEAGMDEHIGKPVDADRLYAVLLKQLDAGSQ